jgi:hypothetical protein
VDPRLELVVEELEPFIAHVEDKRVAQEQVPKSEACCYTSEVEQVLVPVNDQPLKLLWNPWCILWLLAMIFQSDLFG